MTGVFSADSGNPHTHTHTQTEGEMESVSKTDRKRGSRLLSHQQMGAAVIKSIFTRS